MNAVVKPRQGDYTMIDPRRHPAVEPCCVCGSKPQVWRYSESETESTVAVCCVSAEPIGEQDEGFIAGGCLLYMPPAHFYRPRIVEAVSYWNAYQRACVAMREAACKSS